MKKKVEEKIRTSKKRSNYKLTKWYHNDHGIYNIPHVLIDACGQLPNSMAIHNI